MSPFSLLYLECVSVYDNSQLFHNKDSTIFPSFILLLFVENNAMLEMLFSIHTRTGKKNKANFLHTHVYILATKMMLSWLEFNSIQLYILTMLMISVMGFKSLNFLLSSAYSYTHSNDSFSDYANTWFIQCAAHSIFVLCVANCQSW